jgi:cell division protein FtsB
MVGFPYDALDDWRAVYPPEVFVGQLEKVADGFDRSLNELKSAAVRTNTTLPAERRALEAEIGVAEVAAIHFRSSANQARFVMARRAMTVTKTAADAASHQACLQRFLKEEIKLAQRLHRIQSRDSRIGFEASNQYYYVPVDLAEKVLNCRHLLESGLPKAGNRLISD